MCVHTHSHTAQCVLLNERQWGHPYEVNSSFRAELVIPLSRQRALYSGTLIPIMFLAIIFTTAHVRLTNPFRICDRVFQILSYLISAQINCFQTLPGWFTMQRELLSLSPTAGNKWFLSPCINDLLTRTTSVTKSEDLQVQFHTVDVRKEPVPLCAAHWKTC